MVGLAIVSSVLAWAATPAAAERTIGTPYIQAHRGGAVVNGEPTYPENTLPASGTRPRRASSSSWTSSSTKDQVPVIMHDAHAGPDHRLHRRGRLEDADPAPGHCRVGHPRERGQLQCTCSPDSCQVRAPIPTLARGPRASSSTRARKPAPGDQERSDRPRLRSDRTRSPTVVARAIGSSGVPQSRLIIQSLLAAEPDRCAADPPGRQASFLTLSAANTGGSPMPRRTASSGSRPNGRSTRRTSRAPTRRGARSCPYTDRQAQRHGRGRGGGGSTR